MAARHSSRTFTRSCQSSKFVLGHATSFSLSEKNNWQCYFQASRGKKFKDTTYMVRRLKCIFDSFMYKLIELLLFHVTGKRQIFLTVKINYLQMTVSSSILIVGQNMIAICL